MKQDQYEKYEHPDRKTGIRPSQFTEDIQLAKEHMQIVHFSGN